MCGVQIFTIAATRFRNAFWICFADFTAATVLSFVGLQTGHASALWLLLYVESWRFISYPSTRMSGGMTVESQT